MRLHSISFKNFKSFKDETEIVLNDINYLIGPNGAGKSNILSGIQIFSQLLHGKSIPASTDYFDSNLDEDMSLSFTIEMSADDRNQILNQTDNIISDFFSTCKNTISYSIKTN